MTNLSAVRGLCNAIANTFYPDNQTIELALFNNGLNANDEATPRDINIFRIVKLLILGYVEASRSEGGVSISVRENAIIKSLRHWCKEYNLNADEELEDFFVSIENGSNLW